MIGHEKRAFIFASGLVLTDHIPENYDIDNWEGKDGESIDDWVVSHAWEPFEQWEAEQLWSQISDVAHSLKSFHESEVKLTLDDDK